jgi:hypothetical protein
MGQTAISCTDRKLPGSLPELRLTGSSALLPTLVPCDFLLLLILQSRKTYRVTFGVEKTEAWRIGACDEIWLCRGERAGIVSVIECAERRYT